MKNKITNQTLEQLENDIWKDLSLEDQTSVTGRAIQLRRKPLNEFTKDDFRFMIGQEIGLKFLVPIAIDILAEDPLQSGIYYEGDLLTSLLQINPKFWQENPSLWWNFGEVVYDAEIIIKNFQENIAPLIERFNNIQINSE